MRRRAGGKAAGRLAGPAHDRAFTAGFTKVTTQWAVVCRAGPRDFATPFLPGPVVSSSALPRPRNAAPALGRNQTHDGRMPGRVAFEGFVTSVVKNVAS